MKALAGLIPFEEVNTLGGALLVEEDEPVNEPVLPAT
jgi:hypothetical protein